MGGSLLAARFWPAPRRLIGQEDKRGTKENHQRTTPKEVENPSREPLSGFAPCLSRIGIYWSVQGYSPPNGERSDLNWEARPRKLRKKKKAKEPQSHAMPAAGSLLKGRR